MEGQCQRAPEWHLQGTSSKHGACVMGEHCVVTAAGMASSFFVAALESCLAQKRQVSAPVHLRALRSLATEHHLFRLFALRAANTGNGGFLGFSAQGLTHHVPCMCVFVTRHVLLNGFCCYYSVSLLGLKCNTASAVPRFQKEPFLNQMWQESTTLLRRQGLLVSSVAQRMEARFDFLASNRKRYMALDPASKGEWGWFTALVYVILNYVRQERRLKTFWTTTQTVPGSDRLILRAFASAEDAGKSRAGLR